MQILTTFFVLLHMLCWAAAFGMWLAAVRTKQPSKGMAHAAAAAPVFGVAAMLSAMGAGWDIDHMTVGIKFLLSVIVAVCAFIAIKKREHTNAAVWFAIPAGIVINMIIALF